MKQNKPNFSGERIHSLDGLRGLAILAVIIHHVGFYQSSIPGLSHIAHNVVNAGWAGVDLFFVLSGFLITGILLDSKGSKGYFKSFYGRRALRIVPIYYLTVAGMAIFWFLHRMSSVRVLKCTVWLSIFGVNICNALHRAYYFSLGGFSLDHFWSLAVEEQFYLIWPLIVLLLSERALSKFCVLCIVGAVVSRYISFAHYADQWATYYLLTSRMDGLALGALLCIVSRNHAELLQRLALPSLGITFLGTLVSLCGPSAAITVTFTMLSLLSASLIMAAVYTPVGRIFETPILVGFGKYSYGIYVLHVPFLPVRCRGRSIFAAGSSQPV